MIVDSNVDSKALVNYLFKLKLLVVRVATASLAKGDGFLDLGRVSYERSVQYSI